MVTIVDVIRDWELSVCNFGNCFNKYRPRSLWTDVKRKSVQEKGITVDNVVRINHSSLLLQKNGRGYSLARDIPTEDVNKTIDELKTVFQKYEIKFLDGLTNISITGTPEEMAPEIDALRKHYGDPVAETYI